MLGHEKGVELKYEYLKEEIYIEKVEKSEISGFFAVDISVNHNLLIIQHC